MLNIQPSINSQRTVLTESNISKNQSHKSIIKRHHLIGIICLFMAFNAFSVNWGNAQWIWQSQDGPKNTWMSFRKEVTLSSIPATAIANIGVDSKYWLWINGELVKFEGGAARANTWYEEIDLKPYLKKGTNTIALLVWYWGREGIKGSHIDSGKGGLIFQANLGGTTVVSNNTWKAKKHGGYEVLSKPNEGGNNRLAPYNVFYNANNGLGDWSSSAWYTSDYNDSSWGNATQKGQANSSPWGKIVQSYVTLTDHGLADYESLKKGSTTITLPYTNNSGADITIVAKLPFNKQITPYLDIDCGANKVIDISTDNPLNSILAKYTSKSGQQKFESFSWMSGHAVKYKIPKGVTINALKYRWTGIGELDSKFECNDAFYQRLWWMGRNTLYINARDNFMDCPDRERSLWIGDVADQASYLFYTMDEQGRQLMKKAINIVVDFSIDGNVISGQGPGIINELPTQSLQFISQGIWQYYLNTGDIETLDHSYNLVKNYLDLWRFDNNKGLIIMKGCTHDKCWNWVDWDSGNTFDRLPIFNALYYYALTSAKKMAQELNKPQADIDWYNYRINKLKTGFNNAYWKGNFYSSNASSYQDDRVNALAIITGLADKSKHKSILENVLIPNHFCSPHYEWMIEEAMCMAGYHEEALARMKTRYAPQVNSSVTTLNEYFTLGQGTMNHAWNAPNTTLSKHIAGIAPTEPGWTGYSVLPNLTTLNTLTQTMSSVKGDISLDINAAPNTFQMGLLSPDGTTAKVGVPKANITPSIITINGVTVWENGTHVAGISFISDKGEDDNYIWFELAAGNWNIVASNSITQTPFAGIIQIPGTIETENFDKGGQGISYNDIDIENKGGAYRLNEGVDIGTMSAGGYSVGYAATNEWLEYSIDVDEDGLYDLDFYTSSKNGGGELSLSIEGESILDVTSVPSTTDWGIYDVFTEQVNLQQGLHIMRLNIEKNGFNIDKIVAKSATVTANAPAEFDNEISIYPNPSSNGVFKLTEVANWIIYSIDGAQLHSGFGNTIDLNDRSKGVYFVKIDHSFNKIVIE